MNINDYLSVLDSNRFGFKIAKFDPETVRLGDFLNLMKVHDVKLVITKVSLDRLENLNLLEQYGFLTKDIQVTYRFDLNNPIPKVNVANENIIIRDAYFEDIAEVETIAKNAFINYGHYASDGKLSIDKVGDIYGDWARRSIETKEVADKVIIAEFNNEVAGFLTFKIFSQNGIFYAAGGLGCVAHKFRGQNIFPLITITGLEWGKMMNLAWEEHNVLITNYPVNNVFTKYGFKVNKSFVTMHYWI